MNILLNGEHCEVEGKSTLELLVADQGLAQARFAVEVNEEVVPRSEYETYQLREGDRVEIVRAIGGG